MSHILGDPASVSEKRDPVILPSNGGQLLQLPTELLIDICVDINTDYLKDIYHGSDPLVALRL